METLMLIVNEIHHFLMFDLIKPVLDLNEEFKITWWNNFLWTQTAIQHFT